MAQASFAKPSCSPSNGRRLWASEPKSAAPITCCAAARLMPEKPFFLPALE
jgi:hypothetical protein